MIGVGEVLDGQTVAEGHIGKTVANLLAVIEIEIPVAAVNEEKRDVAFHELAQFGCDAFLGREILVEDLVVFRGGRRRRLGRQQARHLAADEAQGRTRAGQARSIATQEKLGRGIGVTVEHDHAHHARIGRVHPMGVDGARADASHDEAAGATALAEESHGVAQIGQDPLVQIVLAGPRGAVAQTRKIHAEGGKSQGCQPAGQVHRQTKRSHPVHQAGIEQNDHGLVAGRLWIGQHTVEHAGFAKGIGALFHAPSSSSVSRMA
jgi:hypothetical protein